MTRTFSIVSTGEPGTLLARARKAAEESNTEFGGDENSGSFAGNGFEGTYRTNGRVVTVTFTKKPFFAPWSLVESGLRQLLS